MEVYHCHVTASVLSCDCLCCHDDQFWGHVGLMTFSELRQRILATSGKTRQDVSEDDMARAIKKLRVLGGGFAVIPVGKTRLVQSVPGELNMDHATVLQRAEVRLVAGAGAGAQGGPDRLYSSTTTHARQVTGLRLNINSRNLISCDYVLY